MAEKPRILVLEGASHVAGDQLERSQPLWNLVRVDDANRGLSLLQTERFDGVYADTGDPTVWQRAEGLFQAERIVDALPDGVAALDAELRILWCNSVFARWCGSTTSQKTFSEAFANPALLGSGGDPFQSALIGKKNTARFHCGNDLYLEVHVIPVFSAEGKVGQLICLCQDVTSEIQQQQKLDALHQAGRELAALTPDQLSEMSVEERIELLKLNIRRLTHDLLHYDVIEIRLLHPESGRLDPLLQEGMLPNAAGRVLYNRPQGNGITGLVAATGISYLCPDTSADANYLEGAEGARSSLTVPLIVQDQVIGTFNVESPKLNAFGQEDLKFTEIFSREIAAALYTLQLLTAEKRSTVSQSIEAVNREVALPVDDILAAATCVLDRYIGHDTEMAEKLRQILKAARAIKHSIQKVGEDMELAKTACLPGDTSRPGLKGLRLLVADNDERVRRSAHSILGRLGCVVETARDGQEALTMARLSTYDVILVDIRLPDLPGYEAYQRLRNAQPQARVILMTTYGYDPSHTIVKARQEGLRSVLFKPFRVDQLLDALESPAESETRNAKCGA
ncbi:MAG TPA: response regulator [Gemmataceae bacterium]|nr:response regulator [Gemmataceae bacterium]